MREPNNHRALVIGIAADVNQRVVVELTDRGIDAVGCVGVAATGSFDAADFEVIAIGSGVSPADRAEMVERFRRQSPATRVLQVYGPFAARQTAWALQSKRWASAVSFLVDAAAITIHADMLASCEARVEIHRYPGGELEVVQALERLVDAGPLTLVVPRALAADAFMLILSLNGEEHHLHRLGSS